MVCGRNGFFIGDVNYFINQFQIQVVWDEVCVDILNFMWVWFDFFISQCLGDNWGVSGFYCNGDKIGFIFCFFDIMCDVG